MKKTKLLLFPLSILILSGCTFNDAKNWFGKNVYYPVRNFIEDVITPTNSQEKKEEEKKEEEKETWEATTSEEILAAYSVKEEPSYKHVAIDHLVNENGEKVEGHSVYNLDESDSVWKIDAEKSTGTSMGDTFEGGLVSDGEILEIDNMKEEGATVEYKKSNLGRYQIDIAQSPSEGFDYFAKLVINKYFYLEEYNEDIKEGDQISHAEQTYAWSK